MINCWRCLYFACKILGNFHVSFGSNISIYFQERNLKIFISIGALSNEALTELSLQTKSDFTL